MKNYKNNKELKVVELFGGIGAIRKALINLKYPFKIVDYVENDKIAVLAYNKLYDEDYFPNSIRRYKLTNEKIDILMHGSPCQDFSIIGNQKGGEKESKTRSSLLYETIRIIKESKNPPRWVIWENVKGVLNEKMRNTFFDYLEKMNSLGYENSYKILNSRDFGIPQNRQRIFVISFLGKNEFSFENLEKEKVKHIKDFLEENVDEKYIVKQKSILKNINKLLKEEKIKPKTKKERVRIIKDYSYTISTKQVRTPNAGLVDLKNGKYRFLTENECFRLMGFTDEDFNKLSFLQNKEKLSSNLYRLSGNSIVVNVLMSILKEIIRIENK